MKIIIICHIKFPNNFRNKLNNKTKNKWKVPRNQKKSGSSTEKVGSRHLRQKVPSLAIVLNIFIFRGTEVVGFWFKVSCKPQNAFVTTIALTLLVTNKTTGLVGTTAKSCSLWHLKKYKIRSRLLKSWIIKMKSG